MCTIFERLKHDEDFRVHSLRSDVWKTFINVINVVSCYWCIIIYVYSIVRVLEKMVFIVYTISCIWKDWGFKWFKNRIVHLCQLISNYKWIVTVHTILVIFCIVSPWKMYLFSIIVDFNNDSIGSINIALFIIILLNWLCLYNGYIYCYTSKLKYVNMYILSMWNLFNYLLYRSIFCITFST